MKCTKCKLEKPIEAFGKKRLGFQTECRECKKIYIQAHYKNNKAYYIEKARLKKEQIKAVIDEIKSSNPCMDCGKKFPAVCMDFDHRIPSLKRKAVAVLLNYGSLKNIMLEIAKCDLVCACCHRIRTANMSS